MVHLTTPRSALLTHPPPSLHSFDYAPITTEQLEEATKLEAALRATPTNELKNQVAELADSLQQGSEKPQLEGARNLWAAMFEVSESKDDYALFALGSTLRKMGDAATTAESDELVALADAAQGRAAKAALWIMGPHLDEISATQVAFLRRLAGRLNGATK